MLQNHFRNPCKCNVQPRQATANPIGGKACSSTKGGLLRYIPNTYSLHKVSSFTSTQYAANTLYQRIFPVTLFPPPRRLVPSLGLGTTWVRQLHSGSGHHPTLPPNVTCSRDKPKQTPSVEKHAHPPRVVYCAIYPTLTRFTKFRVLQALNMPLIRCTNVFFPSHKFCSDS